MVATCHCQVATVFGTDGDDELTGTSGDDVIQGLGGNDTITGGPGNDLVCGGGGNDFANGGGGPDVVEGGPGDDNLMAFGGTTPGASELVGGPGNDALNADSSATFSGGRGSDAFFLFPITGFPTTLDYGPDADRFLRVNVPRYCCGTALVDLLHGKVRVGDEVIATIANAEITRVRVTGWIWSVWGTSRSDHVSAEGSHSVMFVAWEGNDVLRGTGHADTFYGGPGHDVGRTRNGIDWCKDVEVAYSCEQRG